MATHIALSIQGHTVCIDHIDWGMANAMAPLKAAIQAGKVIPNVPGKKMPLDVTFDITGDKVVLRFNRSVTWISMKPQQAADFATDILRNACKLATENETKLVFRVPSALQHHPMPVPADDDA
jgi:hypothetical protein